MDHVKNKVTDPKGAHPWNECVSLWVLIVLEKLGNNVGALVVLQKGGFGSRSHRRAAIVKYNDILLHAHAPHRATRFYMRKSVFLRAPNSLWS